MSRFTSFRPSRSLSPTIGSVRPIPPPSPPFSLILSSPLSLFLSLSFFPPSFVANQSPRGEKRDRRNSSHGFLSISRSFFLRSGAISSPYHPFPPLSFPSALRTSGHLDGRLSTHKRPTSPLPVDRLCPRRENSRDVDLLPPAVYPLGRCTTSLLELRPRFHLLPPLSTYPLSFLQARPFSHVV